MRREHDVPANTQGWSDKRGPTGTAGLSTAGCQPLEVGVDHDPDEPVEVDGRLPVQVELRLRGIPDQVVHFGGAQERGIDPDVLLPVASSLTGSRPAAAVAGVPFVFVPFRRRLTLDLRTPWPSQS